MSSDQLIFVHKKIPSEFTLQNDKLYGGEPFQFPDCVIDGILADDMVEGIHTPWGEKLVSELREKIKGLPKYTYGLVLGNYEIYEYQMKHPKEKDKCILRSERKMTFLKEVMKITGGEVWYVNLWTDIKEDNPDWPNPVTLHLGDINIEETWGYPVLPNVFYRIVP